VPKISLSITIAVTVCQCQCHMSHATLTRRVIHSAMMTDTVTVIVTHAYSNTRIVIVNKLSLCMIVAATVTMTAIVAVPPPNVFSRKCS
jgi:hypothetical protein